MNQIQSADDAFCAALYESYQKDPEKREFISIEDTAAALGLELDALMDRVIDENMEALQELAD